MVELYNSISFSTVLIIPILLLVFLAIWIIVFFHQLTSIHNFTLSLVERDVINRLVVSILTVFKVPFEIAVISLFCIGINLIGHYYNFINSYPAFGALSLIGTVSCVSIPKRIGFDKIRLIKGVWTVFESPIEFFTNRIHNKESNRTRDLILPYVKEYSADEIYSIFKEEFFELNNFKDVLEELQTMKSSKNMLIVINKNFGIKSVKKYFPIRAKW